MKCGYLGAIAFLLFGAGWVVAQGPGSTLPPPSPQLPRATQSGVPGYPVAGDIQGGTNVTITPPPPLANGANGANGPSCVPSEAFAPGSGGPVFYIDPDYLLYKFRPSVIPTTARVIPVGLISVSVTNQTVTPPATTPASLPATTTFLPVSIVSDSMFGAGSTSFAQQNGGRLAFGFWCDSEETWGLEFRGSVVERGEDRFAAVTGTATNPFVINTGLTQTLFVQNVAGTLTPIQSTPVLVVRQTQSSVVGNAANEFYDTQLNARGTFLRIGCADFGGLVGLRYLMYKDELVVNTASRLFLPPGSTDTVNNTTVSLSQDISFNTTDRITVRNNFFGPQAGLEIDLKWGSFFLDTRGTLALGVMHQIAQVTGVTSVVNNDPVHLTPASVTNTGGLLSTPFDNGQHTRDRFAYVPEVNAKLGCQVTNWLRAWVGYDGILIGHAARAADSSVTNSLATSVTVAGSTNNVNVTGANFRFQDRDVWVQGLTFGFEVRY
jgi:hypothetical protein